MVQWHQCKAKAQDAVLFFRLGDFYEAFYEDAILIAKELDLTLTQRQEIPMAGVPFHTSEAYIDKLVAKGFRVAIAEQMEDPKMTKGIVKRDIVRVVTPGTVITSSLITDKQNHFIGCISQLNTLFGLSILDLTTADFRVLEFDDAKQLIDELCRLHPKELLISKKWRADHPLLIEELDQQFRPAIHVKDLRHFDPQHTYQTLVRHFHVHSLDGFGLKGMTAAISAAGALLEYLSDDLNLSTAHIHSLRTEHLSQYMLLDRSTQKNLELVESLHEGKKDHTLLHLIDQTATPMGGRLLKQWLIHPLLDIDIITKRQEAIAAFQEQWPTTSTLTKHLEKIRDLERLIMRIETGYASPRDLVGLRFSLEQVPPLVSLLSQYASPLLTQACEQLRVQPPIVEMIQRALVDAPPLRLTDGNLFKSGYNPELDEIRQLRENSQAWIANYQTFLRETSQIKTLKVGYTKAFGFYIEVSRGQTDRVPEFFQRRQTLVNAERFTTPELKDYEYKVLHAEERIASIEYELFHVLRKETAQYAKTIRLMAQAIATVDALLSLAKVATHGQYARPIIDHSETLHIQQGRHPVIERGLKAHSFVPNDVFLDGQKQKMMLITGPNMAGKSTYIRQVALIVILTQMGSFVPAQSAHIGLVDKVFSRIGASDDLSRGQSTFMVEMAETANILHHATARSLVILDEIGRGTSTYDGISIAWAVAEYLLTTPHQAAKTLFATHYWELTEMEKKIPGVANYHVAVHESDKEIIFLRKIVQGSTDKSYGIHVGKLAGLPLPVLKRAQEMLLQLEQNQKRPAVKGSPKTHLEAQLTFLVAAPPKEHETSTRLLKELRAIDPNYLTPIEALKTLIAWKDQLSST